MWQGVVSRLEESVSDDLISEDPSGVLIAIQSLRQFAVASTMNKAVVCNSLILRPRLIQLLDRFQWWSDRESKVCVDVCGLINSLVRDCIALSEHILSRSSVLSQLLQVVLNVKTENRLREITLLLLRTLFGAEELSSVLCSPSLIPSQKSAALNLFSDTNLRQLLAFFRSASCLPSSSSPIPISSMSMSASALSACSLTSGARCWLIELLALLSTDPSLAVRLVRLGVVEVCHQVILNTTCKSQLLSSPGQAGASLPQMKAHMGRVACAQATNPANQLAARFALKLLAHLLFHVDDALDEFKKVYQETDPTKLVACYGHLTGAVPPAVPRVCHEYPPGYRSKRTKAPAVLDRVSGIRSIDTDEVSEPLLSTEFPNSLHRPVPVCSCAPSAHGTRAFLGLVRGLLYWRLVGQGNNHNVKAVDQFGNHITSATGLGMNADDVALLVLQPLTEGCLHVDDTRIFSWICHVLVLVLDQRAELHLWTVYANSFIREMDNRVTSLIKAVQAVLDGRNRVQFIEHLIPMVKLFACLASGSESIRVLFSELTFCGKLIDFAVNLKSSGTEHANLVLEFQHSIAILLHVLSRSFSAHHSFFRQESCDRYLLQLITDNLPAACRGHSLCADLVESASCALVNILLPQSPIREKDSQSLMDSCLDVLIRLVTVTDSEPIASPRSRSNLLSSGVTPIETTADLRVHHTLSSSELHTIMLRLRLNGIWGMVNMLHGASAVTCTQLFERLVSGGIWLDLLRPLATNTHSSNGWTNHHVSSHPPTARRCSTGSVNRMESKANKLRTRSLVLPESASVRDPMFFPPLSLTPPDECGKLITPLYLTTKRASSEKPVSPAVFEDSDTSFTRHSEAQVHQLLLHKTLMFLHNLLRHEEVIDSVVKEHWWNITQFLVSVLEGNYPQAVKEQAVLVLAHLANGRSARKEFHRNGDLIEKLKLFMRSPDSHIKSAALTATYNLLGLGRDHSDYGLFGSGRTHSDPFLSHQWRLYHRHHRHKDCQRRKIETHNRPTPGSSVSGSSARRDVATCVAQSALEEAEEEVEDEEEQDIVLEHAVITEESSFQIPGSRETTSHRALQTDEVLTDPLPAVQDSTVLYSADQPLAHSGSSSSVSNQRRSFQRHPYRQWWHLSSASTTQTEPPESYSPLRTIPSTTRLRAVATEPAVRSLSVSSSSSSTSSTSCAEDLASTVVQAPELERSAIQDAGAISSTSCSEAELNVTTPSIDPHSHDDTMAESLALDARAPLAAEEAGDETDSQAVQLIRMCSTDAASQTVVQSASVSSTRWGSSTIDRKDTSGSVSSNRQPWSNSMQQQFVCPRRSRRDLETGFRQILLPFLQELESDRLLRNTWDWLMLRANTRGKPVQLHHLFIAWQRLYNILPSGSPPHTISDTLNIESSLFSNCVTVDAFLRRLKDSTNPTCSSSLLAAMPRHRDGRHRRRHHHCHRHQTHGQSRHVPSPRMEASTVTTDGASISTPVPPVTTSEEVERIDDVISDNTNNHA
ncbi:hypothetical protein D915_008793 [Fasciola hepatica]|uniref:Uncharacterized protein n=1 Tax=Fasciola hepatica TaxID=6192 RepID=A0A4E0R4G0_FASHE|nr:hypothetical protein D915_008793 [Fasciola hepatica]